MKVTQYVTAFGNNPRELDQSVNALIAKGFQPHGSPYATDNPIAGAMEALLLAQAMVKCEATPGQP